MNLTFFVASLEKGGSERVNSILANYFIQDNNVKIVILNKSKISYNINSNIEIVQLGYPNPKSSNFFIKILSFFKKIIITGKYFNNNKPEKVIAITSDFYNLILIISKIIFRYDKKIILSIRSNPFLRRTYLQRLIIFYFYKFGDKIVVQTQMMKKDLKCYINEKKISIINNPINLQFFSNPYFNSKNKKYDFLAVGRINKIKNYEYLIMEFYELLIKLKHDFKLCIVGRDDGDLHKIESIIKLRNISRNIELVGEKRSVEKYYKMSSVLVHTAKVEGMPNAILEGKAFGLPIISSDFQGVKEIINHNNDGIIIEKDKKYSLRDAMHNIINNKNVIKSISENSFISSKKYEIEIIASKWIKMLKSL